MYKDKRAKRSKIRIKFKDNEPVISYRLTTQLESTEVKLVDLSETGFLFKINEKDEKTRVGDIIFVDCKNLNDGKSTCFTARIKRFQCTENQLLFAAEFISVAKSFQNKIAKWAKIYLKTGYFLVEKQSPLVVVLQATMQPLQLFKLAYKELLWWLQSHEKKHLPFVSINKANHFQRNVIHCIDFEQL